MQPGQPYPGQPMPGQPYPQGQPMQGQPYPQSQPYPQGQPYSQGQPYPQGQPYGAPGGYGQPPRRSGGGGKIVLILGGLVVLVAIAVGAIYMFAGGGGPLGGGGYDTPRAAAQAWVDKEGELEDLVCASDRDEIAKYENQATPTKAPSGGGAPSVTTTLKSVDVASGSKSGTFTTAMSMTILGQSTTSTATYKLVEEDGGWRVCGILNPTIETE